MSEFALNKTHWTSRAGFILACIGAAVGLGNIWKFPYMTGTQGGGAFVLIYLASIFAIAVPIAAAELWSGAAGNPMRSARCGVWRLQSNRPQYLGAIGAIGVLGSFILLTFYASSPAGSRLFSEIAWRSIAHAHRRQFRPAI